MELHDGASGKMMMEFMMESMMDFRQNDDGVDEGVDDGVHDGVHDGLQASRLSLRGQTDQAHQSLSVCHTLQRRQPVRFTGSPSHVTPVTVTNDLSSLQPVQASSTKNVSII